MPRNLPPLNAIRAFECAARHVSFSAAATELNVSHAAISRHVRGLEARLGVQFFKNIPRGLELTDAGEAYLKELTPALDRIANATDNLKQSDAGVVSISCEPTFAVKWLMPRLGDFYKQYPDVAISLQASPVLADIAGYERDIAIRYCHRVDTDLARDHICTTLMYPFAVPGLVTTQRPADLLKHRLLHEDDGVLWCRWFTKAGRPDVKLPPSNPLSSLLAIEGALAGQGIVLTSPELVADDVSSGRLVQISAIGLDYGGYYLVYLAETARRRAVRAFKDWFIAATAELRRE